MIFGGDMSYRGEIGGKYTFQDWKDLFKDQTAKGIDGIDLYTAIGNHELYDEHSSLGFKLDNQKEFQEDSQHERHPEAVGLPGPLSA